MPNIDTKIIVEVAIAGIFTAISRLDIDACTTKDVGILFANLVNFNELYDESYNGGKEYLRVLNELISDFDELLDKTEFR